MAKITVLGGCGGIGSVAVRALTLTDHFTEIVIGEKRTNAACELADRLGSSRLKVVEVDAEDPASLARAVAGSDVVLNCIGPFYRFGPPILKAVIEAGINYVDVCDDLDATEAMLELGGAAHEAGVTALVGMGNSPGLANVLARFCADEILDRVDGVDIYHAHGGEPDEGAAVIKHRIHAMTNPVPVYLNGRFIRVMMLAEDGLALVEETDFRDIGTFPVYPYPHPETITMPKYIQGVKRVTNMGFVLPLPYFQLTMDMVKLGLAAKEPLVVLGQEVNPLEFTVAWIQSQRPRLLAESGITGPLGCLKVKVTGQKGGDAHTYIFSLFSRTGGAGEGTGIPAALGAMLMLEGSFTEKGVLPPEALVKPLEMLQLAECVVKQYGVVEGAGGGLPIHIEHIGPAGTSEEVQLGL